MNNSYETPRYGGIKWATGIDCRSPRCKRTCRWHQSIYVLGALTFSLGANAQTNEGDLELPSLHSFASNTPFELRQVDLLSFSDLAAGAPISLDQIEPRAALEEFTADRRAGEATQEIAIDDVRLVSLQNNLDIKAQFVRPAIANERVNEEEARFESIFSANLAVNSREPLADPGTQAVKLNGYEANLQLDIPLRTGGTVVIAIPTTFTDPDIPNAENVQDSSLSFSVSQPLLRNAGRSIAETPIEVAKLQSTQEQARTKLSAIQTLSTAESAYWDLYAASATLDIRNEQYQRALDLESKAKRLAQVRVISEIEVTRAKSGVARKLAGIIFAETQRRLTQRNLKQLLNDTRLPLNGPTNLITSSQPDPVFIPLDRDQVAELAIKNRLDLIDLQLQLSVEDLTLLFAQNQQKPALDLNANTTFSNRGDSLGNSFGTDFTSWQIGATFKVPIGNQAAKSQVRRSNLQRSVAQTNIQIQERLITQQVLDALDRLEQSWQQILAARQESALAGETYEAEERQFLAGVRTSTDVLEAADFLAEAQIREIESLASYEKDKISAALATGTLLGKGQIEFGPPPQ